MTRALTALGVRLIVSPQTPAQAQAQTGPGGAPPGSPAPVPGRTGSKALLDRSTDARNAGPGLLVVAGSLVALAATRWVRTERDREACRRRCSSARG